MATPVNFLEIFWKIEGRVKRITDLLRARSYILYVRDDRLSTEALQLLHETHLELEKFECVTIRIVELVKAKKLTAEENYSRVILERLFNGLKSRLCKAIFYLEAESNLLSSMKAPEHSNVLGILRDLNNASIIFKTKFETSDTKPPK